VSPVKRAKVYKAGEEPPEEYTGELRLPKDRAARRRMMKDRKV